MAWRGSVTRAAVGEESIDPFAGPPIDRQLGLELGDPALGGKELRTLRRRQSRLEAPVDPVLPEPGVDGLLADLQVESRGAAQTSVDSLSRPIG